MAYTDLEIVNLSLDEIKEQTKGDLLSTDEITEALNRQLPETRKWLMTDYAWQFTIKRDQVSVDATAPSFGWLYRHAVPSDSLRILSITVDDTPVPHVIEQGWILSDEPDDFDIKYVEDLSSPSTFTAMFVRCLSLLLAANVAIPVPNSQKKKDNILALYVVAIGDAQKRDAIERKAKKKLEVSTFDAVR